MVRPLLGAALTLLLGCAPKPQPAPPAATPVAVPADQLSAVAESYRTAHKLIGLGVGVVVDGRVAYLGGFGHADRAAEVPLDPTKHRLRWASISKTITGTVAAREAAAGRLDLDADARALYPAWPGPSALGDDPWTGTISLRQLLSHTAGVQSYDDGSADPSPPLAEQLDPATNTGFAWALPRWWTAPLVAEPGSEFRYTTMGTNLAAAVVGATAATAGEAPDAAFLRLVQEMFAGTAAAGIQPDREYAPLPNRAKGYALGDDGVVHDSRDVDVSWKTPGGGFISTVQELAEYCALLAGDELMGGEAKALAWAPTTLSDGQLEDYGLGFGVGEARGRRRVEHNGGQEKTRSRLVLYPDEGLCFVAVTNTETWSIRYPIELAHLTEVLEDVVRGR